MDLYFYTGRKDLAATTKTDLDLLIAALADESKAANIATIARVTGKIDTLVQNDTGEPLTLAFYDDASTVASWVTDSDTTLAIGLGYLDPTATNLFCAVTTTVIAGSTRTATLPLNTNQLANALGFRPRYQFYLHIRKTTSGVTETVALLPVTVVAGVLNQAPLDAITYQQALDAVAAAQAAQTAAEQAAISAAASADDAAAAVANQWANKTPPTGTVVGTTDSQTLTNKDLTAASNTYRAATTSTTGAVELATDQEQATGTSTTLATTVAGMAGSVNRFADHREVVSGMPAIADDNAVTDIVGTDISGFTTTFATFIQGAEYATLTPTNGPTNAGAAYKDFSNPTSGDYIIYAKIRADSVAGSGVNYALGNPASVMISLGYNWSTASYEQNRVSFGIRNSGSLSQSVVGPIIDYSANIVEVAVAYDSALGVVNCYVKEAGYWVWYGGANTDDPYDNRIRFSTGGDDAANGYLYYYLLARPNLVSIGDSVTAGHNSFDPDPDYYGGADNGLSQWQVYFDPANYPHLRNTLVTNHGVGGQNSAAINARLTTLLSAAMPRVVFLQASNNDFGAALTQAVRTTNIQASVNQIVTAGARCVLINALYSNTNATAAAYYKTWWDDYRRQIIGADYQIDPMEVLGIGLTRQLSDNYETDGLHLTVAGYALYGGYISRLDRNASRPSPSPDYRTSFVASGSAVSLTTSTAANVTSLTLPAGEWEIEANVNFNFGSATLTAHSAGTGTTSATLPSDGSQVASGLQLTTTSAVDSITIPGRRLRFTTTSTVYLVASATFSAGTAAAYGSLTATRVL